MIEKILTKRRKLMLASYGRSVLAAVLAVISTGNHNPDDLLKAAVAAAVPPIIRWLNKHDKAFGRSSGGGGGGGEASQVV